jgi:uncharacterized protein YdeI (YjbR/CyaY-like superfamily)
LETILEITTLLKLSNRSDWRAWLEKKHQSEKDVWLIRISGGSLTYLDSVEEAICFGWIDGLAKRAATGELAQRFSPRKQGGNWTELNKARAQRLINLGLMTDAGALTLPSLKLRHDISEDIVAALANAGNALENFNKFPPLYRAVRIGYIEEMRKNPSEFKKRLKNFVEKTALNKMFGNWNDDGRLT